MISLWVQKGAWTPSKSCGRGRPSCAKGKALRVEKDFEELFGLFNKHSVRYCIIGSYAVAFYAQPRYTKDIDILIEPSAENSLRVVRALKAFGFESLPLKKQDFRKKKKIIQLGYEPLRIVLLTSVEGFSFRRIWKNGRRGAFGGERVFFIGLEDLVSLKKRSSRLQDKADLETLQELTKPKSKKKRQKTA
jgi:predicted nucleotidyltransferase